MRRFFDFLFPPRVDEVTLSGVSDDAFLASLAPRLVPETRPATVALFSFGNPVVRAAIHEAKYHGSTRAFTLLALALTDYLRDCDDVGRRTSYICIVPVPLSRERQKERGFNQVEEVVRRTARELDITVNTTLLERTRETVSQVSLPREQREENMRGAFIVSPNPAVSGRKRINPSHTYILIDDVITTGATLQAALDALRSGGALHVIPLALAH